MHVSDVLNTCTQAIPPSWGSLKDLKILNLDANHVSDVPVEVLQDCSALQTLCLHSNPIVPAQLQVHCVWVFVGGARCVWPVVFSQTDARITFQTPSQTHTCTQANPGYVAFEERRKSKYDKAIAGGVCMVKLKHA